ncbi:MAG TPA: dTDP-4-dehydrorhamnose reductase [Bacteroidales bacterium]|nr:dTDP-4-dehydrorhamnose reductase [Bacteroidales bacterium]HPI69395.1 dTDP-4-dehydrorhamnose reductase [Bacteroidales bacterium]
MADILITGANGQLGNEIRKISEKYYGYDFVFTDIDTLNLTNKTQVNDFILNTSPDWIINCAAYNFVDKAESETENAFMVNAESVKNIAESVKGTDCKFIHISSDYVFDGKSNLPYTEDSPVNPLSVYGKSKLAGEEFALSHNRTMIIRTSWLYSSFGHNFVRTILKKSRETDSLRVVFDQTGTPTYAADLAEAIIEIVSGVIRNKIAFHAGIYHYSNEGVCTWYDLAEAVISEVRSECKVFPVLSEEYPVVAQRPAYSVLNKSKIKETYNIDIPHWRKSLSECIKLLK